MNSIMMKAINKAYGEHPVLTNFSMEVADGDYVAIVGKSGAGKSTLLNILGLIESADSGVYEINGAPVPKLDSHNGTMFLREKISYLFQNYALINTMSVSENIEIGLQFTKASKQEKHELIHSALGQVGLSGFEKKKIYQLSGGEQQRVALARIIYKPSEIILADEPTGNLDADNRDVVMRILEHLNQSGKTVIVVSHDPCVVKCAKRVINL